MHAPDKFNKQIIQQITCLLPKNGVFPCHQNQHKNKSSLLIVSKKKVVKISFRNLISCLSRGVWKQPESLSPEGRPKTGSLNQCQHTCQWAQNRSDRCSPSPSKLLSDVSQCWYHIQAEKHRAKVQNMKRWDVSKFPAQNGMLFTTANMIFTHITPISPWWLVTITYELMGNQIWFFRVTQCRSFRYFPHPTGPDLTGHISKDECYS